MEARPPLTAVDGEGEIMSNNLTPTTLNSVTLNRLGMGDDGGDRVTDAIDGAIEEVEP